MTDISAWDEDSPVRAYFVGLDDASDYEACDPASYGYHQGEQLSSYVEAYGDGMDINLKYENGVCPEYLRG